MAGALPKRHRIILLCGRLADPFGNEIARKILELAVHREPETGRPSSPPLALTSSSQIFWASSADFPLPARH
jgi:hypothetical protein